jgi:hypothetical protein
MTRIVFGRVNIRSKPVYTMMGYPYAAEKRERGEHAWAFSTLMLELKHHETAEAHRLEKEDPRAQSMKLSSAVCAYGEHGYFAVNANNRGIAITVAEGTTASAAARMVQEILRGVAKSAGVNPNLSVDVDLICSPQRFMSDIMRMGTVRRLTVTVKLPNQGSTYKRTVRKMRAIAASESTHTYENPEGLNVASKSLIDLTSGLQNGDAHACAHSGDGEEWSSQDHPEEYEASVLEKNFRPVSLLLVALAWLNHWPWSDGGGVH